MEKLEKLPFYEPGKPPKPVETEYLDELEATWGRRWGAQGIGKLKMVLVHRPGVEFLPPEATGDPAFFSFPEGLPDLEKAQEEHDEFVGVLKDEVDEVVFLNPKPPLTGTYGFPLHTLSYTRESLVINGGAIIQRSAPAFKRGVERFIAKKLMELGCPILYTVHGRAYWEAANVVYLDSKHVIMAVGLRSNMDGVEQVIPILKRSGVEEIHIAHLPGYFETRKQYGGGMSGVFHLDVAVGMADEGLGVIYPGGVDYGTLNYLLKQGTTLIEVPDEEVPSLAANILTIKPGKVIIPAGNNQTAHKLRDEGVDVIEVDLTQLIKGGGGPHCLTLDLIREPM